MSTKTDDLLPSPSPLNSASFDDQTAIVSPERKEESKTPISISADQTSGRDKIQDHINTVLEFLSNATNETLGACALGLGVSTYILLGRLGLVLIGVFGGIVLHAAWEYNGQGRGDDHAEASELKRRREVGLDVVKRVLDWREEKSKVENRGEAESLVPAATLIHELDLFNFRPATVDALDGLIEAVLRDYVK